jgi:hypothetical protein
MVHKRCSSIVYYCCSIGTRLVGFAIILSLYFCRSGANLVVNDTGEKYTDDAVNDGNSNARLALLAAVVDDGAAGEGNG